MKNYGTDTLRKGGEKTKKQGSLRRGPAALAGAG